MIEPMKRTLYLFRDTLLFALYLGLIFYGMTVGPGITSIACDVAAIVVAIYLLLTNNSSALLLTLIAVTGLATAMLAGVLHFMSLS